MSFHSVLFHSISIHFIPFNLIPFQSISINLILFYSIPYHFIPIHLISFYFAALHFIILHFIWKDVGAEADRFTGKGGSGGGPGPRRMSTAAGDKYGGMSDGAAVHSKWDGTWCVVIVRCPFSAIWRRIPRPPSLLWRLQIHFLHLPFPWLQVGRPCHSASQRALWQGCGTDRKIFHPYSCAQWPPHLCKLRRGEAKGKDYRVQNHKNHSFLATSKGHGTEGWPPDPWPLA